MVNGWTKTKQFHSTLVLPRLTVVCRTLMNPIKRSLFTFNSLSFAQRSNIYSATSASLNKENFCNQLNLLKCYLKHLNVLQVSCRQIESVNIG